MITLHVEPKQAPLSWLGFCASTPKFSIALDGYVADGPRVERDRANFNHHEGCDRLATRSTCAQALMAIRQGLFRAFRNEAGPQCDVYVNDCDEDVCLSWFLLRHHHWAGQVMNPILNRLVAMEDALDSTAGAYPFPIDLPVLRELAWVFQPYREFRVSGGLERKDAASYRSVIEDVEGRIGRHITGVGDEIALDTRYERMHMGDGWVMVRELGAQARTAMLADGIQVYCSVRDRPLGGWTYTIGRLSPFVQFDLVELAERLNYEEELNSDLWGGGNTVIGSPRVTGSVLAPDMMQKFLDEHARRQRRST